MNVQDEELAILREAICILSELVVTATQGIDPKAMHEAEKRAEAVIRQYRRWKELHGTRAVGV